VADRLIKTRMNQAREALEEAKALMDGAMDVGLVLNSLYYAFYYPVIALVYQGQVPSAMQSVVIGLFDQQFISNGTFPKEFSDAIHRVFDLKPKCGKDCTAVDADEIVRLLTAAKDFVGATGLYLQLHQDR
jgi:uncharacterized protein (UPF0332 family)